MYKMSWFAITEDITAIVTAKEKEPTSIIMVVKILRQGEGGGEEGEEGKLGAEGLRGRPSGRQEVG
jgi:hypothetical protein